jgi:hypothetical protein
VIGAAHMGYVPDGQFSFNRAYLAAWQLGVYPGWALTSHARHMSATVDFGGGITQTLHFIVRENVWEWSSNRYTLDHVVERAYNTYSFLVGEFDTTFNVTWQNGGGSCGNSIILDAGSPSKYFQWNAEQTPLPFWVIPPPCPDILT